MARQPQSASFAYDDESPGRRKAWRFAAWAAVSVIAIMSAGVAAYTDDGARRIGRTAATQPSAQSLDAEMDARRLSEAVRLLAADRDRLLARLSTLERSFGEVTGSTAAAPARPGPAVSAVPPMLTPTPAAPVTAQPAAPPASLPQIAPAARPAQPQPGPVTASPAVPPAAAPDLPASAPAPAPAVADPGPTGSVATRTEFGVDLGGAASVDALRALWVSVKAGNDALFEGLRPVVSIREGTRPGTFELRLVAGPLGNAGAAARLCAALAVASLTCQPAVFDGQRLALK